MTETGPIADGRPEASLRRWPRWKSVLLVASLALNLLVFGMFAAVGVRHGFRPPHGASQATVVNFARTLPGERKREIWASIRSERRALRPYWRELRKARAGVRDALVAEPFDVNRYRAAHDQLLEAEVKVRKAAHSLYELVATKLTPDERRAFAQWQERAERPWRRRGRDGRSEDSRDEMDDDNNSASGAPPASKPATKP